MSTLTVRGDVGPEPGHGRKGRDDARTLTLTHTDTDIDRITTAFGQSAALIAEAQHERAQ